MALAAGALDQSEYLVISLEKLLLLKALGMQEAKYHADLQLIVENILADRYAVWWPLFTEEQQAGYLATRKSAL